MKNVVISSRIFKDQNGTLCTVYDQDILIMMKKLNLLINPFNISNKKNYNLLKNCDGLFLMGGGDISKIDKKKINIIRDDFEKKLFRYFVKHNKPIIGICRGFQNIVSQYGVKIFKVPGHVRTQHTLTIHKSRFIKSKKLNVNSYHNYSVKKLPRNYKAISTLGDGTIEVAEHKTKKILCLMFHPERKMLSQRKIIQSLKKLFK